MTQQTISLYDGLEALYYFDPTYFDGTAGEIKDKSGYGRHAQAKGGPTVGVNGPDSFEATRFDGTDDFFKTENHDNIQGANEWALTVVARTFDSPGVAVKLGSTFDCFGIEVLGEDNGVEVEVGNNNGNFVGQVATSPVDRRGVITAVFDNGNVQLYKDGNLVNAESVSFTSLGVKDANARQRLTVGRNPNDGNYCDCTIASVISHSRTLSDAEIAQLARLTAPRRSQL